MLPKGEFSLDFVNAGVSSEELESLGKLFGFTEIEVDGSRLTAIKPAWDAKAPAKIKKKAAQAEDGKTEEKASPWANLKKDPNLINEDKLMVKAEVVRHKGYCGDMDPFSDKKPCKNCNCGLRE